MKNLSREELLSRMEAINRSNAIIYFDLDGFILGCNAIFLKVMGFKEEEHEKIIGKHHSIFVSYEYSKSDEYKHFWETLRSGNFYEGEFERVKVDGGLIYLQATYNPILNENGEVTKIMKIATDVSTTVVAKNEINAVSKSNAVIYFDCDGYILGANSNFLKAMGFDENDESKIIGKHHSIFVSYEYSKSDEYKEFWKKLKSGNYFEGEYERRKMDGDAIYLKATYNPILSNDGTCKKVMKIANDISETVINKNKINELSKNLQLELDNSNKLRASIEIEKNAALNDLDATIKKSQSELIKVIVKCALAVIIGVGFITTVMYSFAMFSDKDTQIIGSTWSNMFSVLLTNAFSIVGTIMGIKYATQDEKKDKTNNTKDN
jgi:methyl-accepting chemotaxis protein